MKDLRFLKDFGTIAVLVRDYWKMKNHDIPSSPGVYILIAKPDISFQYPRGKSPIYYIGKAANLRRRLYEHLKHSIEAKKDRKHEHHKYWPRYEYAASFGGRYTFIHTWQGITPKNLEDKILSQFADRYRSFPVANGAGSWR